MMRGGRRKSKSIRLVCRALLCCLLSFLLPLSVSAAPAPLPADINCVEELYKGKSFAILGDSISTYAGTMPKGYVTYYPAGSLNAAEKTWWGKVAEKTNMTLCANASWSGSRVSGNPEDKSGMTGCSMRRIEDIALSSPDIVFVMMGANDFIGDVQPFAKASATDKPDTSTFAVAYDLMIARLKEALPDAEIFCMTCLPLYTVSGQTMYNHSGYTIETYNKVIREVAAARDVKLIDCYRAGFSNRTSGTYMLSNINRIHPNARGAELIASYVLKELPLLPEKDMRASSQRNTQARWMR